MRHLASVLTALLLGMATASYARAGGGPETTVVVVNADSPTSRQVANAYARRRSIPASHLIEVAGVPSLGIIDLPTFRDKLWAPVKAALTERGLLETTDLIAWSADFPFAVDVKAEAVAGKADEFGNVPWRASLTALTYLWRQVEAGEARAYLNLSANRYFRRDRTAGSGSGMALDEAEKKALVEAEDALKKKEYAAARDAYVRLLASAPGLATAWYNLACCHALLKDVDAALVALTQAVERGWTNAMLTMSDPDLAEVRKRPEFRALVERMRAALASVPPSRGFRSRTAWDAAGEPDETSGSHKQSRYVLSVMLGYTGPWGNSAPEVLACLERAAASADGTAPNGTVYLLANDDVRADTREPFFDGTVGALTRLGRGVAILTKGEAGQDGIVPRGKDDVIGAVLGTAGFAWKDGGSRMMAGAIAENLTSFGADFSHASQTKLAELIRHGAAGSSGTVAEPLALWQKFPVPALHVHYAAGCSLAEAFYQSLAGPWQTLVVGDPLARPFARFAQVAVAAPGPAPAAGTVEVAATVAPARGTSSGTLELWVDGRRRATGPAGVALSWDTTAEDDGVHELRVVAVEAGAVETRSFGVAEWTVSNRGRSATLSGPKGAVAWGEPVTLSGKAMGAAEVDVLHGGRVLATVPVKGGLYRAAVESARLGVGVVPLVARARFEEGAAARSAALDVEVTPPADAKTGKPAKPAKKPKPPKDGKDAAPPVGGKSGLALTVVDEKGKERDGVLAELTDEALAKALAALEVTKPKKIVIEGEVEVTADGLYQLMLGTAGRLEVESGSRTALAETDVSGAAPAFALMSWRAGWNAIRLTLVPGDAAPRLSATLAGAQVAAPIAAKSLRHDA